MVSVELRYRIRTVGELILRIDLAAEQNCVDTGVGAHLEGILEWKNLTLERVYGAKPYTMDDLKAWIAEYGEKFIYASKTLDYSYFGGESDKELIARVGSFLDYLTKDTESETVGVVTHGGVIHAVVANVLCIQDTMRMDSFGVGNCTITVVDYKDGRWKLIHLNNKAEID